MGPSDPKLLLQVSSHRGSAFLQPMLHAQLASHTPLPQEWSHGGCHPSMAQATVYHLAMAPLQPGRVRPHAWVLQASPGALLVMREKLVRRSQWGAERRSEPADTGRQIPEGSMAGQQALNPSPDHEASGKLLMQPPLSRLLTPLVEGAGGGHQLNSYICSYMYMYTYIHMCVPVYI